MVTLLAVNKLEKTGLVYEDPKWVYARCFSCGLWYRYIENGRYKPKTCNEPQCVRRYLHPNIASRYSLIGVDEG